MKANVFFVDDEEVMRIAAEQALSLAGLSVRCFKTGKDALNHIDQEWNGVLITDMKMPGMDGVSLMKETLSLDSQIPVVLVSGHADISIAVKAIKDGAYDFLEKPFPAHELVEIAQRALAVRNLILDNRALRAELTQQRITTPILGRSQTIQKLNQTILDVAETDADVLISGETGTGKELVASTLHELSGRHRHSFVAINCGAMPENLFESELFGHVKGAFTSADREQTGKMEHANGGTFFLDEIESMPLSLQVKMLRVLQERKIQKLGSNSDIDLDIRVVAATKTDLLDASSAGDFREDLFYRLNVVTINIPPLRDRKEDIPVLFQHFYDKARQRQGKDNNGIDSVIFDRLIEHDWPGNVRELRNHAERAAIGIQFDNTVVDTQSAPETLAHRVDVFEKLTIEQELIRHSGNITQTYESLGISRKTLYDKMKKYGLSKEKSRQGSA